MQNLSLQSSPNSAITKMSALTSKQDSSANSTKNSDNGPAFKDLLSSQVRSQQPASKQAETQQSDKSKPTSAQDITQGMNKVTQAKQQSTDAKPGDTKPTETIIDTSIADQSKIPATQDIAGLSFEDLNALNKTKKLSEDATSDSSKSDTSLQQPLATDPVLAALGMPVQANIVPVQANIAPVQSNNTSVQSNTTPVQTNILPVEAATAALAKDNKLAVATSGTTAATVLDTGIAEKTGVSTKEQANLAKSDQANTGADLTSWVNSVLPNQSKQLDASLAATKLDTAAVNEQVLKSVTNATGVPNVGASMAFNPLNAMQAGSSNIISSSPGKTGWDQAISQKMVWMVGAGEQSATLTLNPPDLGPLQVVIHVHNNQADTTFISDNSDVRRALQDGLSNLKDMLGQSGINLGQANINSSQQEQQARQSSKDNSNSGSNNNQTGFTASELDSNPMRVTRVSNGLVDTFV